MKLTAVILLAFGIQVFAKGNAQTVSFSGRNISLEKVFSVIERQTNFVVFYEDALLKLTTPVTLNLRNSSLEGFLNEALKNQPLEYSIKGETVFISRKPVTTTSPATQSTVAELPPPIDVRGRVTTQDGEPAIATVTVKGTNKATSTNANGEFTLTGVDDNATLVITGVNIDPLEVKVSGENMNISVNSAVSSLQETVVVGYGREKKVNLIGSVVAVSSKELAAAPVSNISNALAGRLPGAIVQQRNGEPGSDNADILIRGRGTLGNNSPLIVIDGIPGRDLNSINVNDVESISVLKDAAAGIYGSRAANGVILVTTKRGKTGKPTVNYGFYQGFLSPTRLPKMADAATYAQMIIEMQTYEGVSPTNMLYDQEDVEKYASGKFPWTHPNTNWYDEVLKDFSQNRNHNISVNGGTDAVKYYFSFGNQWADALYKNSPHSWSRYNLKGNIQANVGKYLTLGLDIAGIQDNKYTSAGDEMANESSDGWSTDAGIIFNVINQGRPNTVNRFPNGYWATGGFGADYQPGLMATSQSGFNDRKTYRSNNILSATFKIPHVEGLSLSSYYAYDIRLVKNKYFQTPMSAYTLNTAAYLAAGNTGAEDGTAFLTKTVNPNQPRLNDKYEDYKIKTFNFRVNYDKSFNDHNLNAFVAYESADEFGQDFNAFRRYFISSQIPYLITGGDRDKNNGGSASIDARVNYFGRISYNYKETYLFQFSLRRDGSLRFPKESRFGNFPSILAGWVASNEDFWGINNPFSFLKLKASWGQLGNDFILPFQFLATYNIVAGGVYGANRVYQSSISQAVMPNPVITWETANSYNAGFESMLFNNKLTFNADFFYQRRNNILVARNASVPEYAGISLPSENFGIVDNRGVELELGFRDRKGDFSYSINGNFAFARNKIIEFDEPARSVPWQVRTGHPMSSQLLYKGIGIFRDLDQISKTPHVNSAIPGDVIIQDTDGDGQITPDDRILFDKNADPEVTFGLAFNLRYRNLELSGLVNGAAIAMRQMLGSQQGTAGNYYSYYADGRWTPDNINATKPRAYQGATQYWRSSHRTDMEFQDMNYARLKNLQLAYNLPASVVSKLRVQTAQFYVSAQNLFLLYASEGIWEPEFGGDRDNYPLMRTLAIGANISF
ncbi:MAG TPA: TonB-dependent receptor [Flavitalea sp.]|nr:TonB-dependent receptor [Flavitalea sp.]